MAPYTSLATSSHDVELGHPEAKTRDLRIAPPPGLRRASSLKRRQQERTRRFAVGGGVTAALVLLLWAFSGGRREEKREVFGPPPPSSARVGARTGTVPNATTVRPALSLSCALQAALRERGRSCCCRDAPALTFTSSPCSSSRRWHQHGRTTMHSDLICGTSRASASPSPSSCLAAQS